MSKFIPDPGLLFYASVREKTQSVATDFGVQTVVVSTNDQSYSNRVLKCIAADNHAVIAQVVWCQYNLGIGKTKMLPLEDFIFKPLGPGVAKALKLVDETDSKM